MKTYRGTSIIEIVIATALISVSIIAALSLTNNSQKQNTYAKGLAEATKYTTQAADWVRTQRNSLGYATIAAAQGGNYCLNDLPTDFSLITPGSCASNSYIPNSVATNNYQRTMTLTKIPSDISPTSVKIQIQVSWPENSTTLHSTVEMELTQW